MSQGQEKLKVRISKEFGNMQTLDKVSVNWPVSHELNYDKVFALFVAISHYCS